MNSFELIPNDEWFDYDLKVTLKPCYRCNQRCWFCSEWDNSTSVWSQDDCDVILDKLESIPTHKQKIFFYMYGGEPTLSKHWEYLQYNIIDMFRDREIYMQTQTNMSVDISRLGNFLENAHEIKSDNHSINICGSYHLNKQPVGEFLNKMILCDEFNSLGLCFFNTEIEHEYKTLYQFMKLAKVFPSKMKLRFTQLENMNTNNRMSSRAKEIYSTLMNDEFLAGDDHGESLEYRYYTRKYPKLENYLEDSWTFNVDGTVMKYNDVLSDSVYRKFKFMKCAAGTDSMVIDHLMNVYRCNDYYYSNINPVHVTDLNITEFLSKPERCLSCKCADGLELSKFK